MRSRERDAWVDESPTQVCLKTEKVKKSGGEFSKNVG